jgi:hypothetical protein
LRKVGEMEAEKREVLKMEAEKRGRLGKWRLKTEKSLGI